MENKNPLRGQERRVVSTKLYRIEFVNFMKVCNAECKKVNAKLREMITSFVDFLISFVILIFLMFYYSFFPSWEIIFVFGFLLLAFLTALGTGLFITSLNVKYRDFRYIVPFIVQLGLYISPVGFSSSVIPEQYRFLYSLNPMVGVIDGFRWSILGDTNIYIPGFILSIFVAVLFLIIGLTKFRKMEKSFADMI